MATVILSKSFDFLAAHDWRWSMTQSNSSSITLTGGIHSQQFTGTFTYDSRYIYGQVTSTQYFSNGQLVYSVTGMTSGGHDATMIQRYAETYGDTQDGYAYVLSGNDTIRGSSGNDTLLAFAGNDVINGGAGSDIMFGGAGNDVYYVENVGDQVHETTTLGGLLDAGGIDIVYSSLPAYTLGQFVENARIMANGSANLTGNQLNNVIYAGQGDNVLIGGSGIDTLSYAYGINGTTGVTINLASTTKQATGGSANDTISGFENLNGSAANDSLSGTNSANTIRGGNGNDALLGAGGNDTLYGDAGNDLLRGGAGNDILFGGEGKDTFRFDTALSIGAVTNIDQIRDFVVIDDSIQLENLIFTRFDNVTRGTLNAEHFTSNLSGLASDSNDYIVYENDTGKLFYDSDGNGAGASVQIALLGANLALTHADFFII